ncbi:polymerase [Bacillus cereus]|nr:MULTISPECIES: hypothetical protein [Bacillus]MEC2874155.1 polymerase [Bacillus cereus]AGG04105.1 hypothetical protein H175_ch5396 [Bacillus thuringiensis serovar thuringiensis str. IS5056]MCR6837326.1 polymerase [Bacillus thuringiensis]MDY7950099.1 polymerase [Bacillus thuringiensis]MEB4823225.1 polymerase [Bacillus thuringiensis]
MKNKNFIMIFCFIGAFLGFLTLGPYFTWGNHFREIVGIVNVGLFIILSAKFKIIERNNIKYALMAMVLIFLFSFRFDQYYNIIFNGLFYTASLVPFVLVTKKLKLKIYDYFIKIIAISYIPAIMVAILLLIGIDLPWEQLASNSTSKSYYRQYLGLANYAVYYDISEQYIFSFGGSIDRICAMFNEPGVVGTVSALILISKKMKLKSRYEKIILIAGVLSLSFAFYFLVVAYLMLKSRRNFIIIAFSSIIIFSITPKDSFLYNRLLYRFEINSEGLAGNNRVNNGFEYLYKDFHENGSIKDIMLGIGESQFYIKSANYNSSALSWKTFIVIDGYILFCLHALFFIYMGLRGGNKNTILFIIIYFASLYQRPFDFSLGYWLIFFAGILYSLNKEENTVDNKSLSRGNVNEEKSIVCN